MRKRYAVLAVLALLLSGVAHAVPLTFVEATDLPNSNGGGANLGFFDVGLNTISGSVLRDSNATVGAGDYGDFWEANVAAGQQITSISILITNHTGAQGFFVGAADDNVGGFGPFGAQAYANLIADGLYPLAATVGSYPFGSGEYYFGVATNVGTNTGYSYEWRITVAGARAPEPGTLLLLGAGLFGVGLSRRRRAR